MKKLTVWKVLIFALFLTKMSLAKVGSETGNGGDAVICTQAYRITAEMLDTFEGRVLHKLNPEFGYSSNAVGNGIVLTHNQLIQRDVHMMLRALDKISPLVAKKYHEYTESFFDEANFVTGVELVDIPDSNSLIIPKDCRVAQTIIQVSDALLGQKRYIINKDIWSTLNEINQRIAVLHEVIYRVAIENGQTDSRWTRYLNALFFSDNIATLTPVQFANLRRQAYHNSFFYNGYELAGSLNANQNLYQIISAPASATFGIKLVDGIYDMQLNHIVDAYLNDPLQSLEGFFFPQGLSLSFSDNGNVNRLLTTEFQKTSEDLTIISPTCDRKWSYYFNATDLCGVTELTWDQVNKKFQLQNLNNKILMSFTNGVQFSFNLDPQTDVKSDFTKDFILNQFCKKAPTPDCIKVIFDNNVLVHEGWSGYTPVKELSLPNLKIQYLNDKIINYEAQTTLTYKIPANYAGNLKEVQHSLKTEKINFNPNGNYNFLVKGDVFDDRLRKYVTNNGIILDLPRKFDYEFSFDKDGYLLSATQK